MAIAALRAVVDRDMTSRYQNCNRLAALQVKKRSESK